MLRILERSSFRARLMIMSGISGSLDDVAFFYRSRDVRVVDLVSAGEAATTTVLWLLRSCCPVHGAVVQECAHRVTAEMDAVWIVGQKEEEKKGGVREECHKRSSW